jgi:hypothetical protein
MHPQLAEAHQIYVMAAEVRDRLLAEVHDDDLAFALPGNPSLGELLAEHASAQQAYVDSFATRRTDWGAISFDSALASSISALAERFAQLDGDLVLALEDLGDGDPGNPEIDRDGWTISAGGQLHTLREALIITMGKAVVYLRALGRPIPERVQDWVG